MTKQRNMKLGQETEARIKELSTKWSPVELTATQVVRECVKRIYEQETKPANGKKTSSK